MIYGYGSSWVIGGITHYRVRRHAWQARLDMLNAKAAGASMIRGPTTLYERVRGDTDLHYINDMADFAAECQHQCQIIGG